jgi:predicted kinase
MNQLIILRGIPGCGKSTYVKKNLSDYVHCEADQFFMVEGEYKWDRTKLGQAHNDCQKRVDKALEQGKNVVVSNTNIALRDVNEYIKLANKWKVSYKIIRLVKQFQNVHNVPTDVVLSMQSRMVDIPGEIVLTDY